MQYDEGIEYEYQVWNQLREEEAYWDTIAKKVLLNKAGLLEFNENEIIKNKTLSASDVIGLKNYLLHKYGTLLIEKL